MKLTNFLRFDPQYLGKGLERGSKLDEEVWNDFSSDIEKLKMTANSIAKSITLGPDDSSNTNDEEFAEGKILTILHMRKERNRKAVEQKKKRVLQETGKLECEVCGFDFFKVYGSLGYGFAECHHTFPVYRLTPDHKTRLEDLAILCSNCHRMIHKDSHHIYTVQELRRVVQNNLQIK